jgi:hypothetical protein
MVAFQQGGDDLAFPEPGVGQAPDDRHALGSGDQVQPEPQKNREWLAQYPYPACPARSERRPAEHRRAASPQEGAAGSVTRPGRRR